MMTACVYVAYRLLGDVVGATWSAYLGALAQLESLAR
jgi:hypothetical protein